MMHIMHICFFNFPLQLAIINTPLNIDLCHALFAHLVMQAKIIISAAFILCTTYVMAFRSTGQASIMSHNDALLSVIHNTIIYVTSEMHSVA